MTELATTEHVDELANEPDHKMNIDNNKTSLSHFTATSDHKMNINNNKTLLSHFTTTSRSSPPQQTWRSRPLLAPLNSETPAVALCLSSKRQATPLEQGKKQAMTMRSKTRRCEQGSKAKLRHFCLANIPTAAIRCRHCTSILNHTEWRHRGSRHTSTVN